MGSSFVLTLAEAIERLGDIERIETDAAPVTVALPASYGRKPKAVYPLVLLVGADEILGSAVEISRLMAETGELLETIVAAVQIPPGMDPTRFEAVVRDQLLPPLQSRYRVLPAPVYAFGPAGLQSGHLVEIIGALGRPAEDVFSLVTGLRAWLATGKPYARQVPPLRFRPVMAALVALRPLFARLARRQARPIGEPSRFLIRAAALDREFEVFVVVPPGAAADMAKRFPALFVLDASIELSIVAETAARLAAAGTIPELAIIGIGVPRREGTQAAGFRRFEEFSPPPDAAAWQTELGRIFRSLFALIGRDARRGVDRAPDLRRFLVEEVLPRLVDELPIDADDVGILGHSAGATFVLYTLHTAAPFRRFVAISPGIAMSGSWLLQHVDRRADVSSRPEVWLTLGGEERTNHFNRIAGIPETPRYAERLAAAGDVRVTSTLLDGETHSSVFPRAVGAALVDLYGHEARPR